MADSERKVKVTLIANVAEYLEAMEIVKEQLREILDLKREAFGDEPQDD